MSIDYIRILMLGLGVIFFSGSLHAQGKEYTNEGIIWSQFTEKVRVNDMNTLALTIQHRAFLDRDKAYHLFFKGNWQHQLAGPLSIGAGFVNLNINVPSDDTHVLRPELRPYQFVQMDFPVQKGSSFTWRLIAEERFFRKVANGDLIAGHDFQWRFRNLIKFHQPLTERLDASVSTEIMLNAKNVEVNVFDQNRLRALLGYSIDSFKISSGYMHWFVQTATNRHENRHSWVVMLSHRLN